MNLLPFLLAVLLATSTVACGGAPFTGIDVPGPAGDDSGMASTPDALGAPAPDAAPSVAPDAAPDAVSELPDAAPPLSACRPYLMAVSSSDFAVAFDLQIGKSAATVAIASQRIGCSEGSVSSYWDITMSPAGGLMASTSDGAGHIATVEEGNSIDDGKIHHMVFGRTAGSLWLSDDGVQVSSLVPDAFGIILPSQVNVGVSSCAGIAPLAGHGVVTGLCLTSVQS